MNKPINTTKIYNFLQKNKLSYNKFAKMCCISPKTLKKILCDDNYFNMVALFKISRVMNVTIIDLIKKTYRELMLNPLISFFI